MCFYSNEVDAAAKGSGIRAMVQRRHWLKSYFLAPVAALSMLEGLLLDARPAFILPLAAPVVVPFFMLVCLVALLVAPGPTFPSLEAPGAGCIWANTPPVDSNRAQVHARIVFFMRNSLD